MLRKLLLVTGFALTLCLTVTAQEKKDDKKDEKKLTVDLFASIEDEALKKEAPESGVIVSAKAWEKLAKAWGIKDPAKVDFDKEILLVATTVGSRLNLGSKLDDKGDLRVVALATRDLRPGFRYAIKSVSKEGIKTVDGKPLPKE